MFVCNRCTKIFYSQNTFLLEYGWAEYPTERCARLPCPNRDNSFLDGWWIGFIYIVSVVTDSCPTFWAMPMLFPLTSVQLCLAFNHYFYALAKSYGNVNFWATRVKLQADSKNIRRELKFLFCNNRLASKEAKDYEWELHLIHMFHGFFARGVPSFLLLNVGVPEILCLNWTRGLVVVQMEQVLVVAKRLLDNVSFEKLMDFLNGISSGFWQEEYSPEAGAKSRATK